MDIRHKTAFMGLHGTMDSTDWTYLANVDGQRVRIPPAFAKLAGVDDVSPKSPIDCWLLVLKAGKFLVQRQSTADAGGPIPKILRHMESLVSQDSANESDEEIAIRARLFPCVVTWHDRGPRLNLPKEIFYLAPGERSHIYFVKVEEHIEIWFPETLQKAVSVPLSEVLG